jgi:hypothetical protein
VIENLALAWDQGYFNCAGGFNPQDGSLTDQLALDNPYRYGDDEAAWLDARARIFTKHERMDALPEEED